MNLLKPEIEQAREYVRQIYGERCIRCSRPHVRIVHEIIPRSKRPSDWWALENMVPLCTECHAWAHPYHEEKAWELRSLQASALGVSFE